MPNHPRTTAPVGRASCPTPPAPSNIAETRAPYGYRELRRGRVSHEGADYFLTVCLRRPANGLDLPEIASALFSQIDQLQTEGHWHIRTAVIMPDHLHLLATLKLGSISAAMRLVKGRTAALLHASGLRWQPSFYDHRIRLTEELGPIFRYILLNPYRKGLLPFSKPWPHYRCAPEDWTWFGPTTNNGRPWPEWADWPDQTFTISPDQHIR